MTGYCGAFSTSKSKFRGQIQLTNIDTSNKSILTCFSNKEKNRKNYLSKMLPRLCPPPPPPLQHTHTHPPRGAELWGAASRVSAASHRHRSTRTRELQCAVVAIPLCLRQKASFAPFWEHFFYSHEATLARRSLVFGAKFVSSSAVVNLHKMFKQSKGTMILLVYVGSMW